MSAIRKSAWLLGIAILGIASAVGAATVNETYTYDAVGRLTEVVREGTATQYTYDASGNILARVVPEPGAGPSALLVFSTLGWLGRRRRR